MYHPSDKKSCVQSLRIVKSSKQAAQLSLSVVQTASYGLKCNTLSTNKITLRMYLDFVLQMYNPFKVGHYTVP